MPLAIVYSFKECQTFLINFDEDSLELVPLSADNDGVRAGGGSVRVADDLGGRHDAAVGGQLASFLRRRRRCRDAVAAVPVSSPTSALRSFDSGHVEVPDGVLGDDCLLVVVAGDEAHVGRLLLQIPNYLLHWDLHGSWKSRKLKRQRRTADLVPTN